jgi:hypothetical protein
MPFGGEEQQPGLGPIYPMPSRDGCLMRVR